MKKIIKYPLMVVLAIVMILIFFIFIFPVFAHWDCYKSGGVWRTFQTTGVDICGLEGIGGEAFTAGCDCGPDKCWNGEKCVPNPTEEEQQTQKENLQEEKEVEKIEEISLTEEQKRLLVGNDCAKKYQDMWEGYSEVLGYVGVNFEMEIEKEQAIAILDSLNLTKHNLRFPGGYDYIVKILDATNQDYIDWISNKEEVVDLSDPTMLYVTVVFPISVPKEKAKELIHSSPFEVEILNFWQTPISGKVKVPRGMEGYWFCEFKKINGIRYGYLPIEQELRTQ